MLSVVTMFLTPIVYLFGLFGRTQRRAYIMVRMWARTLIKLFGVHIRIVGAHRVDFNQPVIYMSNHLSMADIPVLMTAIPAGLAFVAKASLANVPFLGWSMRMVGMVFISRRDSRRDVNTLQQAVDAIPADMNFLVFPEGTRSDLAGRDLAPLKKGGFHMAMASGRTIVPVALGSTERLMPKDSLAIFAGPATVRFGNPINPTEYDCIESLMQAYRTEMDTLFALHRPQEESLPELQPRQIS